MAKVRVPKTPKSAFNKNRRASKLLRSQIDHLEWAVRPASQRKPAQLPKTSVRTEGQAAARIAELTQRLLPAPGTLVAVGVPARPPVTGTRRTRKTPPRPRAKPAKRRR